MANSDTTFDLWQQVFCLSTQSGWLGSQKGLTGTAAELADALAKHLTGFYAAHAAPMGGAWSTVWGPVVFEADATRQTADNVMYVAANHDRSVFVVAVAGTNFASKYDIDEEDEAVDTRVEWTSAFSSLSNLAPPGLDPYLSSGTRLGVENLLAMTDGRTTLREFLASVADRSATLIFTGHSLGGALAPTLALALFNSHGGPLRKADWADVHFFATAGPTPGNADLSTYVAQEFPPVDVGPTYQCWNRVVWNSLDAVPQGWVVELLNHLPKLYDHVKFPWPPPALLALVELKVHKSRAGAETGGPYTQLANRRIEGKLQDVGYPLPVENFDSWKAQMAYQHVPAYDVLLGVLSVRPPSPAS